MNILISGMPGCGKSTLIQQIIASLKEKRIAGIITPEIRDRKRTGFKIIDLATGHEEILSSVNIKTEPHVGRYGVNVKGIDTIVDLFLRSLPESKKVFIDEIGKMESFSQKFKAMCDTLFECDKTVVAVVHRNLVQKFKGKGKLIWLERDTFDRIKNKYWTRSHRNYT